MRAYYQSPIGKILIESSGKGIKTLIFTDGDEMTSHRQKYREMSSAPEKTGRMSSQCIAQLDDYFSGKRKAFDLPLDLEGTIFQKRVWEELRRIPYGQTISYDELARRIGQPTAMRAVANANRLNCVCILIPCHRVIGKDGSLTGYGGGLWRKRLLLELERGHQPGSERVAQAAPR